MTGVMGGTLPASDIAAISFPGHQLMNGLLITGVIWSLKFQTSP